jgi:hypothetical protein
MFLAAQGFAAERLMVKPLSLSILLFINSCIQLEYGFAVYGIAIEEDEVEKN